MNGKIAFPAVQSAIPRLGSIDQRDPTTHFHITNQRVQLQTRMKILRNEIHYRQYSHYDSYLCPANNGSLAYGLHLEHQFTSLVEKDEADISKSEQDWLLHLAIYSGATCLRRAAEVKDNNDAELYEEFQNFFNAHHEILMVREGFPKEKREKLACKLEMAGDALNSKKIAIEEEIARNNNSNTTPAENNVLFFDTIQDFEDYVQNHSPRVFEGKTIKFNDDEPRIAATLKNLQERFDHAKQNWDRAKKVFIRNRKLLKQYFQRQKAEIPSGYLKQHPCQGYLNFASVKSAIAKMFTHGLAQDDNNPSLFTAPLEDIPGKHSVEFVGELHDEHDFCRYISEIFYTAEGAFTQGALTEDMLLPSEDYFATVKANTSRFEMTEAGVQILFRPVEYFENEERIKNREMAKEAKKKASEAAYAMQIDIASALKPGLAHLLTRMKNSADQSKAKRRILAGLDSNDFLEEIVCINKKGVTAVEKKRKNEDDHNILAGGSKQRTISAPPGLRRTTSGTRSEDEDDMRADGEPKQRTNSAPPGLRRSPTMRSLSVHNVS